MIGGCDGKGGQESQARNKAERIHGEDSLRLRHHKGEIPQRSGKEQNESGEDGNERRRLDVKVCEGYPGDGASGQELHAEGMRLGDMIVREGNALEMGEKGYPWRLQSCEPDEREWREHDGVPGSCAPKGQGAETLCNILETFVLRWGAVH